MTEVMSHDSLVIIHESLQSKYFFIDAYNWCAYKKIPKNITNVMNSAIKQNISV